MTEQTDIGKRLDVMTAERAEITRSAAQKWIEIGAVTVNGLVRAKNYRIGAGDEIEIVPPAPVETEVRAEEIPLSVIYEDDDMLIVNKPKGMVVHPAAGNPSGTLVNALLYHCEGRLSGIGGVIRPGIVHRIDKDTSGLLAVAKNDAAHLSLSAQIASHEMERRYVAICRGNLKSDAGTVDAPIGRHPTDRKKMAVVSGGREARTDYTVLERFGDATFLSCRLHTGRTHQIRVHLASLGHPLLGDNVYGGEGLRIERELRDVMAGQCLHAKTLTLIQPRTGQMLHFDSEIPDWMEIVLQRLRSECERRNR